jgi:hypothetical protein
VKDGLDDSAPLPLRALFGGMTKVINLHHVPKDAQLTPMAGWESMLEARLDGMRF